MPPSTIVTTIASDRARRDARRARWSARETLWRESHLKRARHCGRYAAGDAVSIMAGGAAGAGYSGVQTCGSVWVCAVCSEKVNASRRNELQAGVEAWISNGGGVAFGTLTLSHHRGDRLSDLWDAIGPSWSATTSKASAWRGGARQVGEKEIFGIAGYVRVVEVKHGTANGWHPHVHFLLFLDTPVSQEALTDLARRMFGRWEHALADAGIRTSWAHGIDLQPVTSADGMADYLAKATYQATPARAAYEVTGSHSKTAGKGGRTPFELLRLVVDQGDADALDLWHEWERASKGRRQLTWSRGMRDRLRDLGADLDDRTDQEIAEAAADGSAVLEVSREGYKRLIAAGLGLKVLEAVAIAPEVAADLLEAAGVMFWWPGGVSECWGTRGSP